MEGTLEHGRRPYALTAEYTNLYIWKGIIFQNPHYSSCRSFRGPEDWSKNPRNGLKWRTVLVNLGKLT